MSLLVLIRHGESQWNEKGLWTGLTDISLNEAGKKEAEAAAEKISNLNFDVVFTSPLKRAKETYEIIKNKLYIKAEEHENSALNERDYGVYTGKNKLDIQKELGDEEFLKLRRGWNTPIENGETLQDVYNRVIPYYKSEIEPYLLQGKNVLVVAHGNSLRALVKYLDNVSDADIEKVELATGEIYLYTIDQNGSIINKEIKYTK